MVVCVAFGGGPRPPVELPPSQGSLDAQVDVLDGPKAVPSTLHSRLPEVQTVDTCQRSLTQFYVVTLIQSGVSVEKVRFLQRHNRGLRQLSVCWGLRTQDANPDCSLVFLKFWKQPGAYKGP